VAKVIRWEQLFIKEALFSHHFRYFEEKGLAVLINIEVPESPFRKVPPKEKVRLTIEALSK